MSRDERILQRKLSYQIRRIDGFIETVDSIIEAGETIRLEIMGEELKEIKEKIEKLYDELFSLDEVDIDKESEACDSSMNKIGSLRANCIDSHVLLATAGIKIKNGLGKLCTCRALLDSGSQVTMITKGCCERLGLVQRKSDRMIIGVGNTPVQHSSSTVSVTFCPLNNSEEFSVEAVVTGVLTSEIPNFRFRTYPVAITADIEKMYRQIKIHPEDADYQRILWRPSPEEPVVDYRLLTVTYGTTSAPFLAMRTLQQLAEDEGQNYPEASRVTLNDFYVDDLLTGAQTIAEAKELIDQLTDLMKKGGFHLRKWNSNCHEIVSHVEEINEEKKINLEKGAISKILGIVWDHVQDTFRVNITLPEEVVTKRDLLSNIARIFDPLGFLSPTTVALKIIMQELWRKTARIIRCPDFRQKFSKITMTRDELTISRRLVANGLHSCRPLRRLPLTPPNRRQRLEWCRARSTWMTEWHRVVFSDESRFCLSSDSRRVRVWRRRGERSNPAAIVERPTVRQRGIMVWGAIAYDSRSPLLRIQGTMTAQRYVDDVLRPVTLPYLQGVPNALYQQDNARPHTARINQQALQDVQMLPWPPYSPELSPIEHVWDIIGRRLHALPQPRSEDELWQMAMKIMVGREIEKYLYCHDNHGGTISRRLVANGLHSCRPLRRLPLTPPNRRQRLEWCRARSTWMMEWHRVVFSDESRFCLSSDSRHVRVWRRRGERSNPAAIVERPTVRQRGIMVWGAIAYDSRSPLLRIQGTMTAQRYVDDVLRPVTLPYLQGVPNALYQQDNARPHTARISQQALQDVQMLPWPPYSPDLSPIEHVWDIIGRRLHALPQPRSEDELWQMVEREWRAIPQDAIRTLIDSLPRRVAACIAVRGGPTCY
ncbi:hypothetical protein LAZ67_10003104 [Cordylochernes scorpioides]|uniref:Transposable element Tc1 transposase n=1 Tax=Cordylochernes scorpioides TaxID=51811 RepID=A0ABY6KX18_9ARAC|nr:hypothetical protein LAZ67_10003104 [Cordylochernes scorpioides]